MFLRLLFAFPRLIQKIDKLGYLLGNFEYPLEFQIFLCYLDAYMEYTKFWFFSFGQQLATNHITVKCLINCQKTACLLFIIFVIF